jgi:hypothetical protein
VTRRAAANAHRDAEQLEKSEDHCDDNYSDNSYNYDDANTTMANLCSFLSALCSRHDVTGSRRVGCHDAELAFRTVK